MKKTGSLSEYLDRFKSDSAKVNVGVIEEATYPTGESVAQVAFWNEYGTATAPARPFFRKTINDNKSAWIQSVGNLMKIHGGDTEKVMSLMGEHIKGQITQSILTWTDPPNSAYTVAKKGFNKPLVDTAQMSRSISYEVVEE